MIIGNTNWKHIFVLVILAVLFSGGVVSYLKIFKKEIDSNFYQEELNREIYKNEKYGFEFKYPKSYTSTATNSDCVLVSRNNVRDCEIIIFTRFPQKVVGKERFEKEITDFNVYVVNDLNNIVIQGQTDQLWFNKKDKIWEHEYSTLRGTEKTTLQRFGYTLDGHEIFKHETGGSHAGYCYYIVPDYQKNFGVIFRILNTYRLRCDLIENSSEQLECYDFLREIYQQYGEEQDNFIPREYFSKSEKEIEETISTLTIK